MNSFNNKKEREEQERIERVLKLEKEKDEKEQKELERIEKVIQENKKKLEELKRKIELKKEQQKLNLQEQLHIEQQERLANRDKFINEIRENYICISNGITKIKQSLYGEYRTKQYISENSLSEEEISKTFNEIVLDIYNVIDNVSNYKELTKKVFEYSFIQKISKKYLQEADYQKIMIQYKNSVQNIKKDFIENENRFMDFTEEFMSGLSCGFHDVFESLKSNYEYIDLILLKLIIKDQDNIGCFTLEEEEKLNIEEINPYGTEIYFDMDIWSWDDEIKNISYFTRQLFYAFMFVYYLIFLRKLKEFKANEELIYILNNIQNENEEICQVLYNFYPIYINFYENTFEYKLTIHEIEALILAFKNKEKFDSFIEFNYYQNILDEFKRDKDLKKLVDSIDKNIFMKYHSVNDFRIVDDKEYFYDELFDYIIAKIIRDLSANEILDIAFNKSIYIDRLKKNDKLREILKNKNKYLYDIKEQNKINKLDINNVKSGNDFENFLKDVFLRLGYHVVLTKQTRDQGADLIIEKELVKIVVQAKFYEGTVGNKAVQEVIAAKSYYDADSCMVVTNSIFTSSAYELAKTNKVRLVNGNELNSMIEIANLFLE